MAIHNLHSIILLTILIEIIIKHSPSEHFDGGDREPSKVCDAMPDVSFLWGVDIILAKIKIRINDRPVCLFALYI